MGIIWAKYTVKFPLNHELRFWWGFYIIAWFHTCRTQIYKVFPENKDKLKKDKDLYAILICREVINNDGENKTKFSKTYDIKEILLVLYATSLFSRSWYFDSQTIPVNNSHIRGKQDIGL